MRVVRSKSIPNVDVARLQDSLAQVHATIHTPDGIHAWDAPRRGFIETGIKGRKIAAELVRRGEPAPTCSFCYGGPDYPLDVLTKGGRLNP